MDPGNRISFKVVLQIEGQWYGEIDFDLFGTTAEQLVAAKQAFIEDLATVAATWDRDGRGHFARIADSHRGEAISA